MNSEAKNEANEEFVKCSKNENIMLGIYVINFILMIIVSFNINETLYNCLNYILIISNIIYVAFSGFNDIILKNKAENELRKTMIANSFNINITTTKTSDYYTNNVEPSIERMGMNCFESTLYTNKITEKMIMNKFIKVIILIISWIILITKIDNIARILLLTQIIFSTDVLLDFVKIIYYYVKVNQIYNNFYRIFVTNKYDEKNMPMIIEFVMEYECLKNYCHITLSDKIFREESIELEQKWKEILDNIDANKEKSVN